jgi:hypothetical protein
MPESNVTMTPEACWKELVRLVSGGRWSSMAAREVLGALRKSTPQAVNACKAFLAGHREGCPTLAADGRVDEQMEKVIHALADAALVDPRTGDMPPGSVVVVSIGREVGA